MPISQRKYDDIHDANIDRYLRRIKKAYNEVINKVANKSVGVKLNANKEFYFRNHPKLNKKVNELLKNLNAGVRGVTVEGINSEWDLAVEKNNDIARYVYGKGIEDLPKAYKQKYLANNYAARVNFKARKTNGLGLSDKIWKNTRQFKTELELSLGVGIGEGKSAQSIARDVKGYLNEPDKLYRRVREGENGALRLSKAAKAYSPGQGRYRSSYKNALRLTANETNFSYEGSQQEKRKQQDFIVGIKIHTSPRHTPADDKGGIKCIDLQGKYPKDFNWTYKWHVNCRCYSINILKNRKELDADNELIFAGKQPNTPSKNAVRALPNTFTSYVNKNNSKWVDWKSKPRFMVANNIKTPSN